MNGFMALLLTKSSSQAGSMQVEAANPESRSRN